jgi:hypothetical protein
VNPTDQALWTRGLDKLKTAPSALTDAEREVLTLYGSDRDRARLSDARYPREPAPLMTKAAPPAPPAASRAWVNEAFDAYTTGVATTLTQALALRDAKIAALEADHAAFKDRLIALEADQAVKRELVP